VVVSIPPRCGELNKLTGLDSDAGIVHMAPDVCEDLGLQAKLANGLAV